MSLRFAQLAHNFHQYGFTVPVKW